MSPPDMTCPRCGQPLDSFGDCPRCGERLISRVRPTSPPAEPSGLPCPELVAPRGRPGWVCPLCGRANSPYSITCPCVPFPAPRATYGSAQYGNAGGEPTNRTVTATN